MRMVLIESARQRPLLQDLACLWIQHGCFRYQQLMAEAPTSALSSKHWAVRSALNFSRCVLLGQIERAVRQTRGQQPSSPSLAHSTVPASGAPSSLVPDARARRGALWSRSVRLLRRIPAAAMEFNRPDVTEARPDFPDIDPAPPQLIGRWTGGVVARINRRAAPLEREVAISWDAIIPEGA